MHRRATHRSSPRRALEWSRGRRGASHLRRDLAHVERGADGHRGAALRAMGRLDLRLALVCCRDARRQQHRLLRRAEGATRDGAWRRKGSLPSEWAAREQRGESAPPRLREGVPSLSDFTDEFWHDRTHAVCSRGSQQRHGAPALPA